MQIKKHPDWGIYREEGQVMNKFRTVVSVVIMVIAGVAGLFAGAALNEGLSGAILFSLIAGIACIIYTIDNQKR